MAEKAGGKKKQQQKQQQPQQAKQQQPQQAKQQQPQQPKQQQPQQPKQQQPQQAKQQQPQQSKKQQPQQQKQQLKPQQQQQQSQQKNKKVKQPEKKKNQENGVKRQYRQLLNDPYQKNRMNQKKKNKENNITNNNNLNKSSKKKSGSNGRSFLRVFSIRLSYVLLILGFIYLVDYEKYVRIRDGASYYVNKTVSLLPPEVLIKGKEAIEFVQPVAEVTLNKATFFVKEVSSFLNTNPVIKDHWTNIREISSICSARLVDYMRTLYIQTTGYCNDVKTKLFN